MHGLRRNMCLTIKPQSHLKTRYQLSTETFCISCTKWKSPDLKRATAFWDTAPCSLEIEQHFRGTYCLQHQGDNLMIPDLFNNVATMVIITVHSTGDHKAALEPHVACASYL
jgi:hypothetical protein